MSAVTRVRGGLRRALRRARDGGRDGGRDVAFRFARQVVLLAICGSALLAQGTYPSGVAVPSRADSMLAVGRLAAAEQALYSAADATPRAPAPRGALGAYLASRGRFRIAEILFQEAQRFGANPRTVQRAIAVMAPYRVRVAAGPVVAVPISSTTDRSALFAFPVRGARGEFAALLDPRVRGVVLGRGAAEQFTMRGGRVTLQIGARTLEGLEATVDSLATPDVVRIGLDALWALHPQVDERAGMLTLGRAPDPAAIPGRVEQIPFVLTFPGMLLVPRVGFPPFALESREGRALLRGARWQIDAATATITIER